MDDNVFDLVPGSVYNIDIPGAIQAHQSFVHLIQSVMRPGIDYQVATKKGEKPALLKPGAESILKYFNMTVKLEQVTRVEQFDVKVTANTFPLFQYTYTGTVYASDGRMLVTGVEGQAHSYETKWAGRWVPLHELPTQWADAYKKGKLEVDKRSMSEFEFAITKGETTGKYGKPAEYWEEWRQAIENGTAIPGTRETSKGPSPSWTMDVISVRIPNARIFDEPNTIMKMAQKRCYVACALLATGASRFFTQDTDGDTSGEFDIYAFVPTIDLAKKQLIGYIAHRTGLVRAEASAYIKEIFDQHSYQFSLDKWKDAIDLLESAIKNPVIIEGEAHEPEGLG